MPRSIIQGMDTIPREIANGPLGQVFRDYLPGWVTTGAYNFQPGATTQKATAQLEILMQNGSHPWINKAMKGLFEDVDGNINPKWLTANANERTRMLSALVNFMSEASGPEALASGGARTGNYVAFASRSDPSLIAKLGYQPTTAQMEAIAKQGIDWNNILDSHAGRDVLALNPRTVGSVGSKTLVYDGKLANGGFFSKLSDELASWTRPGSTGFSRDWIARNGITQGGGGYILKNGHAIRKAESVALLAAKTLTPGAATISSFAKTPLKLLGKLAKPLAALGVVLLSSTAASAQGLPGYNTDVAAPANKDLIEELFGLGGGALAGLVAGALAGAASFGLLAIPAAVSAGLAGDAAGRAIGSYFYDNFTSAANEIAEWIAPVLAPIGDLINAGADAATALADAIEDVAGMLYGAMTDAFEYVGDIVSGPDGLFGIRGPLFGPDGPLHDMIAAAQKLGFLTNEGQWAYDGFDAILYGTDGDDVLIHHEGVGKALGGKGDDVLIGVAPRFVSAGDSLFDDGDAPIAEQDTRLVLDGGVGNDWLYNTSSDGEIWGDVANSYRKPGSGSWERYYVETDAQGGAVEKVVADDVTNRDVFWWSSGTTIMDAQKSDVLKFFGIPLTGGTDDGGLILSALGFGAVGAVAGAVQANRSAVDTIYVDHIMPFLTYKFEAQRDGGYDLLVGNVVSDFLAAFDAVTAGGAGADFDRELKKHRGVQVVKNFVPKGADGAFAWSYGGFLQGSLNNTGPLNLVFKKSNPIFDILARLPDTLITSAASGGGPLADLAICGANDNDALSGREAA